MLNDSGRVRVAIVCDFAEEGWPSMDLVGDMLTESLRRHQCSFVEAVKIRPRFVRRFTCLSSNQLANNADRLLNRMFDYPRYLRRLLSQFDLWHITDHSYSHLVHELRPGLSAVVTCHDLFTFRCVLRPDLEHRHSVFRLMAGRILAGLRRAQRVSCVSESTRGELLRHRVIGAKQATVIPNGVARVFSPMPETYGDRQAARLLGSDAGAIEMLNVGSTAPRKRIDVLLRVFAAVRTGYPGSRLIRVGGRMTAAQTQLAQSLGVRDCIVELPYLDRRTLAGVYRRAVLVLCPSEAEGFGLPMLESMACGTPVIASKIGAFREVGAQAVEYATVGDVKQWTSAILDMLGDHRCNQRISAQRRQACIERAKDFSWVKTAAQTAALYRDVLA
jgi:glycosyltransferase involved in cell wall biosynthesis